MLQRGYTKITCNLYYKIVYAFAFLFDRFLQQSDKKGKSVEEPWATSSSYQVQTGHRHRQREKRMLIGISIRSVTSKRSCALDGSPSCKRVDNER